MKRKRSHRRIAIPLSIEKHGDYYIGDGFARTYCWQNAALISAAPELLEACENLLKGDVEDEQDHLEALKQAVELAKRHEPSQT